MISLDVMAEKMNIGVIFGGRSGEHEVSLMSAESVLSVLDRSKYNIFQIGITHEGAWFTGEDVLNAFKNNSTAGLTQAVLLPEPQQKGMPVRLARPENLIGLVDQLQSPSYSTSIGLLKWAELMDDNLGPAPTRRGPRGPKNPLPSVNWPEIKKWLTRLLPYDEE